MKMIINMNAWRNHIRKWLCRCNATYCMPWCPSVEFILMSRDGTAKSLLSVLCRKLNRRRHWSLLWKLWWNYPNGYLTRRWLSIPVRLIRQVLCSQSLWIVCSSHTLHPVLFCMRSYIPNRLILLLNIWMIFMILCGRKLYPVPGWICTTVTCKLLMWKSCWKKEECWNKNLLHSHLKTWMKLRNNCLRIMSIGRKPALNSTRSEVWIWLRIRLFIRR